MLERAVGGGRTGADQAGWRAVRAPVRNPNGARAARSLGDVPRRPGHEPAGPGRHDGPRPGPNRRRTEQDHAARGRSRSGATPYRDRDESGMADPPGSRTRKPGDEGRIHDRDHRGLQGRRRRVHDGRPSGRRSGRQGPTRSRRPGGDGRAEFHLPAIPSTPDALALVALMPTATTLHGPGAERSVVLPTIVPPKPSRDAEEARAAIAAAGLPWFTGEVRRAVAFQKAALQGVAVSALKDGRAAAARDDDGRIGTDPRS
ncbi:MAG TPA: hypothetical protein VKP69_31710 [Isosphaeraceae bacterium]|nr:hypothetical protein [Isosphaeraceae bacterium]